MDVPIRIEVSDEGSTLTLEWSDGVVDSWPASQIRNACNCADCRVKDTNPLRLMAPTLTRIGDAHLVGGYGINFTFLPDAHSTGIFTFTQLRELSRPKLPS